MQPPVIQSDFEDGICDRFEDAGSLSFSIHNHILTLAEPRNAHGLGSMYKSESPGFLKPESPK